MRQRNELNFRLRLYRLSTRSVVSQLGLWRGEGKLRVVNEDFETLGTPESVATLVVRELELAHLWVFSTRQVDRIECDTVHELLGGNLRDGSQIPVPIRVVEQPRGPQDAFRLSCLEPRVSLRLPGNKNARACLHGIRSTAMILAGT